MGDFKLTTGLYGLSSRLEYWIASQATVANQRQCIKYFHNKRLTLTNKIKILDSLISHFNKKKKWYQTIALQFVKKLFYFNMICFCLILVCFVPTVWSHILTKSFVTVDVIQCIVIGLWINGIRDGNSILNCYFEVTRDYVNETSDALINDSDSNSSNLSIRLMSINNFFNNIFNKFTMVLMKYCYIF